MAEQQGSDGAGDGIGAVERAFTIVGSIQELDGCGVSELANHLDIPKSTAHIYLKTLRDVGYVRKKGDDYRLGLRFLEHGGYIRQNIGIYQAARREVDGLSRETGEVANLGIEEDGWRVLLYTSEPPEGVFDNSPIGQFTHMHWTALGKALLAHLPEERIDAIVDRHGLPRATEYTVTDRDELVAELETIREQGYSIENEDRREGIKSIAVPVRDTDDHSVVGAISLSGPKRRIGEGSIDEALLETIQSTVNVIELKYQHY